MRQCVLQKRNRQQVAWIPSSFAIHGKFLRIHTEDGWQVLQVFPLFQKHVELPHGYFAGGVVHG